MSDKKITQLTALTGANTAAGDQLAIVDVSDTTMSASGTTKKIALNELQAAPFSSGTANGVAYLNGSKVLTTGSALTFDGTTFGIGVNTLFDNAKELRWKNASGVARPVLQIYSDNNLYLDSEDGAQIYRTLGTERMRLTSTGLGIGTSSPAYVLNTNYSAPVNFTNAGGDFTQMWQASGTNALGVALNTGDTTARFVTNNGYVFAWNASSTELMRLNATGLGIGTSSPAAKLDVLSGADVAIRARTSNSNVVEIVESAGTSISLFRFINTVANNVYVGADSSSFIVSTGGTERMRLDSSGRLLVGATSNVTGEILNATQATANTALFVNLNAASSTASAAIEVRKFDNNNTTSQIYMAFAFNAGGNGAGGIQGNGSSGVQFYSSSDARLKENVKPLESQLANIMALKPSKFDYINGPKDCTGFIAQEMEQIYPDTVGKTADGYKTIGGISTMEARLIKAIQEQQAIITALTARVAALESI